MLMGSLHDTWEETVRHSITAEENLMSEIPSSIVPPVSDRLLDYLQQAGCRVRSEALTGRAARGTV